jgi:hypothetical protein
MHAAHHNSRRIARNGPVRRRQVFAVRADSEVALRGWVLCADRRYCACMDLKLTGKNALDD